MLAAPTGGGRIQPTPTYQTPLHRPPLASTGKTQNHLSHGVIWQIAGGGGGIALLPIMFLMFFILCEFVGIFGLLLAQMNRPKCHIVLTICTKYLIIDLQSVLYLFNSIYIFLLVGFSAKCVSTIGIRGSPPPGGLQAPLEFSNSHFCAKKHVIYGQNHLIFGQAMEKIFRQLTSAPINDTGPVYYGIYLWLFCCF